EGSVAGIDELNRFMEDWVCPSLKNQTEYFCTTPRARSGKTSGVSWM
nr:hypothetical protein [Tanacetum cinerariifolium]